jgi:rRNA maturation endonuclease Nob1
MKKIECPGCAIEVDADNKECPICGYEFPSQPKSVKIAVWLFILLILLWIFF